MNDSRRILDPGDSSLNTRLEEIGKVVGYSIRDTKINKDVIPPTPKFCSSVFLVHRFDLKLG